MSKRNNLNIYSNLRQLLRRMDFVYCFIVFIFFLSIICMVYAEPFVVVPTSPPGESAPDAFSTVNSNFDKALNKTGVSGGQTIIGGTDASDDLSLSSTSNATKGQIVFGGTLLTVDEALSKVTIPTLEATDITTDTISILSGASINGGLDVTGDTYIVGNLALTSSSGDVYAAVDSQATGAGNAYLLANSAPTSEAVFEFRNNGIRKWILTNYGAGDANILNLRDGSYPGSVAFSILPTSKNFGVNTTTQKSKLEVNGSFGLKTIVVTTTPYSTSTTDDSILLFNSDSSAMVLNLEDASLVPNRIYYIKNIGTSTNDVTCDAYSTQQIDGSDTVVLSDYDFIAIIARSSNWHIIGD